MNKYSILSAHNIFIRGGSGGSGKVSFRRERFVPFGGPDGGNGGDGGSVILKCDKTLSYLDVFKNRRHFYGEDGESGRGKMQYGKKGEDLYIFLPRGTEVYDEEENLIIDLLEDGQEYIIAHGGNGGVGNMHLANSIDKAPRHSIPSTPGEEKYLSFQLKIIADVGLIGFPNAGKSSLINYLTNCKSLVGNYPFTTVMAHLGVLSKEDSSMTIVDIPGLIKDSSKGKGMGIDFLQNIERSKALAFVLNGSEDYSSQFGFLLEELNNYNPEILKKKFIIIINKSDLMSLEDRQESIKNWDYPIILINTVDGENIDKLKDILWNLVIQ
jgi:GTP-binding protein